MVSISEKEKLGRRLAGESVIGEPSVEFAVAAVEAG